MTFSTASSQYSEQGNFAIFLEAIASDRQRLWLTRAESGTALGWSDVLSGWQQNPEFRQLFTQSLADLPYAAFFWETPPLSGETLLLPFECCVIDSPRLAEVTAAPEAFADYIGRDRGEQVNQIEAFPSLKGDTLLVVPGWGSAGQQYAHLAAFVRSAPASQAHALWKTVGRRATALLNEQGRQPLWISTSGLGVYWLHVRLDTFPKYYRHLPYQTMPASAS
ncbi:MAG: hypothetical protein HC886_11095 [Leptolyngbyaceae cyanobacterium SM1_1_3]|nr:hypothetical protein [Leptolyngbyaceae cyanobacterium SM1_1_3]NJN02577.1 hypothetical protein [Leptolyngbyaceae cyanobacterium RM1_1_2]NJO08592.1 hypothetical protein [Leptolyngbyaceae cyanobacterium SL_1_1]